MAQKPLDKESLTCPICLDLLSNPVTIPCGHSFCLNCIDNYWPRQGDIYQCPQCRKRFTSRPALNKSIILADLVEQIKKAAPGSEFYAGPRDVSCDVCLDQKLKAVKSCLQCVVSYCESHLRPHRDVPMLKKHQLVAPSNRLQENICGEHNEVKKMFCRTDQLAVCGVCCKAQHRGHDTVLSADERAQKQAELEAQVDLLKSKVTDKKEEQQKLSKRKQDSNQIVQSVELYCKKTFTEMEKLLKNIQAEVYQHINSQLHTEMDKNNRLNNELHQEILNLTKKISDLEELAGTQEHNHFLLLYTAAPSSPSTPTDAQPTGSQSATPQPTTSQSAPPQPTTSQSATPQPTTSQSAAPQPGDTQPTASQSAAPQPTQTQRGDSTSFLASPLIDFQYVIRAMKDLMERFQLGLGDFSLTGPEAHLSAPQPVTRRDFLCYRRELTLDRRTAHPLLQVVHNSRKAMYVNRIPMQQNEFRCGQVLSIFSMVFRSYWEVDVSQAKYVSVAVTYKRYEGVSDANKCQFGYNDESWALKCDNKKFSFCFNSVQSDVVGPVRPRIGVYLDPGAGILSFYSVSDGSFTLLHEVRTSFPRPLYAGLGLGYHGDRAGFVDLGPPAFNILD